MPKLRTFWVDFIRVVAIFLVVLLHSAAPLIPYWNKIPSAWWHETNAYDSLARICVPLFVMVSGFLLFKKPQESYTGFLSKRLKRIVPPWLFWGIIYLLAISIATRKPIDIFDGIFKIFNATAYFHFPFMHIILGLYVITPIVRIIAHSAKRKDQLYYVIIWYLGVAVIPFLQKYWNRDLALEIPLAVGFTGYFLLGYWLPSIMKRRNNTGYFLMVFMFSTLSTFALTYYFTQKTGIADENFYDYLSPTVILQAISAFLVLKKAGELLETRVPEWVKKFIEAASAYSFGIYFIHVLILRVFFQGFFEFSIFSMSISAAIWVPLIAVISFGLSFMTVALLKRVPIIESFVS